MYDWTVLNQAVSATLASGRIGPPVFVRWTASAAQSKEELKPLLGEMSAYTGVWLASTPRKLYAAGAESHGHLSLSLEFENGSSALLALTLAHGHPFVDLAIYGADGAIYHTDSSIPSPLGTSDPGTGDDVASSPGLSAADALIAVDQSLAGNQPVLLSSQGGRQ